jgi:DNA (cytosine-5)-methyltransferase 1
MKELSLFSGAGGGILGTQLLGWETIGYVEYNEYCQRVIRQRIEDGCLDNAPIFSDVNAFISEGYADAYKGMVGVISAGFPCQPFSVAGKKAAKDDPRNCWPQTLDIIRRVRPRYCLLENVGGLLSRKHRYFETILKDLAESGYDAWWKVISAAEVGGPHKRDRLWIVAHSNSSRKLQSEGSKQDKWRWAGYDGEEVAHTSGIRLEEHGHSQAEDAIERSKEVSDTSSSGLEGRELPIGEEEAYTTTGSTCWWDTEPRVGRVANGMAHRVDRLKALGNGQVPAVAATAFKVFEPDVGQVEWRRQRALTRL